MKTFAINTRGCKVNQYESQQIRQLLEGYGLTEAEGHADLVIVNSCCVTHIASSKSRQLISNAKKRHRGSVIVLAGCLAAVETGELNQDGEIHIVKQRGELAAILAKLINSRRENAALLPQNPHPDIKERVPGSDNGDGEPVENSEIIMRTSLNSGKKLQIGTEDSQINSIDAIKTKYGGEIKEKSSSEGAAKLPILSKIAGSGEGLVRLGTDGSCEGKERFGQATAGFGGLRAFKGQTRAFLKVQDGCDGLCTYCIIPKARPVVESRGAAEIIHEAQMLVAAGHKEIVVTGIFLGAYGMGTVRRRKWEGGRNPRLAELLWELSRVAGLERIRLSSLEPGDVTEELLDLMRQSGNIVPHLHLSLQSGSDNVLRKMARQYRAGEFLERVEMIKSKLDMPAITTDMIVGFPGEREDDFERSCEIAERVGFAKIHVFSFSARKGTVAARMQGAVDKEVISRRSEVLRGIDERLQMSFREQFIGRKAVVLIEQKGNDYCAGRTERYFMVRIPNAKLKKGDLATVEILGDGNGWAQGHCIRG